LKRVKCFLKKSLARKVAFLFPPGFSPVESAGLEAKAVLTASRGGEKPLKRFQTRRA